MSLGPIFVAGGSAVSGDLTLLEISSIALVSGSLLELTEIQFGDGSQNVIAALGAVSNIGFGAYVPGELFDGDTNSEAYATIGSSTDVITAVFAGIITPAYMRQVRRDNNDRQISSCNIRRMDSASTAATSATSVSVPASGTDYTPGAWVALTFS